MIISDRSGNQEVDKETPVEIDQALIQCEHRKFHYILLAISGLAFLSVSCEFTLHAYILPFAECDLQITAAQMGFINAFFLGGSLVSSLFWGVVSDTIGRKVVLIFGTIGQGVLTFIASWSTNVEMFIVLRAGTGFMCGSAATVLLSFVGEFCDNRTRPRTICVLGFCWIISWWMIPAMSWLIIPLKINWNCGFLIYRSWRLFLAIVTLPSILSGILLMKLPESPKFYLSQGREQEALDVLSYIYSKNTGTSADKYPVHKLISIADAIESEKVSPAKGVTFISMFWKVIGQIQLVFTPPLLKNFLLSGAVYSCAMFGYYSLGLWLPELLKRFDSHYEEFPNSTLTLCELSKLSSNITTDLDLCSERTIHISLFTNTFILGGASLLGNLSAVLLSNKIPVRLLSGAFFLSGGISAICIYFIQSHVLNLIFAAIFLSAGNAGLSVHNSTAVNLFPTAVRGIGICVNFLFGRLSAVFGSIIFGLLIEGNCAIPIFMVAAIYLLGAVFCILIPKSSQRAIE